MPSKHRESPKDIVIIGAGACGIGAALSFIEDKELYKSIKIYERRPYAGGVWNYIPKNISDFCDNQGDNLTFAETFSNITGDPEWISAAYDSLTTNVPHKFMSYKGREWPKGTEVFCHRSKVLKYIQDAAKEVKELIEYKQNVVEAIRLADNRWKIHIRATDGDDRSDRYVYADALIVANGNYDYPRIPDIVGLSEWRHDHPRSVIHSKFYTSARDFSREENILVIGNGSSAIDICSQLADDLPENIKIYKSVRSRSKTQYFEHPRVIDVSEILKLDGKRQAVSLKDGSELKNISKIILATGYLKSIPFLSSTDKTSEHPIIRDGSKLEGLYKHIMAFHHPGLFIIPVTKFGGPMILSQLQGAWISRVLQGQILLPSLETMVNEEARLIRERGRQLHELDFPSDVDYYNDLVASIKASKRPEGNYPDFYSEDEIAIRKSFALIKYYYTNGDAESPAFFEREFKKQNLSALKLHLQLGSLTKTKK